MAMIARMTSDVDYLICISKLLQGQSVMSLICTYMATVLISVKPQPWNPIMREGLKRRPIQPSDDLINPISQIDLSIVHLPRAATTKSTFSFSTTHLLKATTGAAEYLASLGHNVFVDTTGRSESEGLYILYDTVKLEDAFEVPTVSLFVVLAVVVICAVAWAISELFYQPVYNGSLYKVVFREIEAKDETTPMLMNCAHGPLAFEGDQVVPLDAGEQPEGTATPQDLPLLPIDNEPTLQRSTQLTPLLEEIPPHSPLLISRRLLAPTPTFAPATFVNDTNSLFLFGSSASLFSHPATPITSPPIPPRPPRPSQRPGNTFEPIVPSRPVEYEHNPTPPTSAKVAPLLPPPQTTGQTHQASSAQGSTFIQNPFHD